MPTPRLPRSERHEPPCSARRSEAFFLSFLSLADDAPTSGTAMALRFADDTEAPVFFSRADDAFAKACRTVVYVWTPPRPRPESRTRTRASTSSAVAEQSAKRRHRHGRGWRRRRRVIIPETRLRRASWSEGRRRRVDAGRVPRRRRPRSRRAAEG